MTTNPSPTHRTQPTSARPSVRQRGAQRITQATAAIGGIAVAVTGAAIALTRPARRRTPPQRRPPRRHRPRGRRPPAPRPPRAAPAAPAPQAPPAAPSRSPPAAARPRRRPAGHDVRAPGVEPLVDDHAPGHPQAADLPAAREIVDAVLDDVELAASRFRPDGEILRSAPAPRSGSARRSPSCSSPLSTRPGSPAGRSTHRRLDARRPRLRPRYRRGPPGRGPVEIAMTRRATWRDIRLDEANRTVTVPQGGPRPRRDRQGVGGRPVRPGGRHGARDRGPGQPRRRYRHRWPDPGPLAGPTAAPLGWDVLVRDRDEDPAAMVHPTRWARRRHLEHPAAHLAWVGHAAAPHHRPCHRYAGPALLAQRHRRGAGTASLRTSGAPRPWSAAGDGSGCCGETPAGPAGDDGRPGAALGGWPAAAELGGAA